MHAYFTCGKDHVKVSGTQVKGGEGLSCILQGYPELHGFNLKILTMAIVHLSNNNLRLAKLRTNELDLNSPE